MNKKKLFSIIKKIAKYEILWLFLYLVFSLVILIVLIASVFSSKTTIIINSAFIIFDIFSIISLLLYILSIFYLDNKEIYSNWTFYVSFISLLINLIGLPILVHYLKIDYPIYRLNVKFSPKLSAILWIGLIFSVLTFIGSIAMTAYSYKMAHPFNPPIKKPNDMEK